MKKYYTLIAIVFACLATWAQEKQLSTQGIVDIEAIYKENEVPTAPTAPPPKSADSLTENERQQYEAIKKEAEFQASELKSVTDLNDLSPFNDVSMIQKKYLPKTERFQLFTALGLSTNSPWFLNLGGKVNLSYNFTEKIGVEFSGLFLTSSEKDAAKDIRENNSLEPERFILTKSNLSLDLVWSPIYGKVTTLDNKIIPFDMYFSVGGGTTSTNSAEKNVASGHIATGQIFALSKSFAFRWDYSWYMYQATPVQDSLTTTPPAKGLYNDLVFTAGLSFFFPEARYR